MEEDQIDSDFTLYFKILLLGEEAVGKTSLIRQYVEGSFDHDYKTTLGADFKSKTVLLDNYPTTGKRSKIIMQLWDIAGKARLSSYKKHYFSDTAGVFLVFDATRRDTLTKLLGWVEDVNKYSPKVVKYLIGNKIDLNDEVVVHVEEMKQFETILEVARSLRTSAKTGENVEEAFTIISRMISDRAFSK
ncbi:MAG: Rab family GTPase [Candidatus Hodarchaeales archaeon]